ncbi:MAG: ribosome maturation factor RimM [Thermodesulfobacteriota bacterium]
MKTEYIVVGKISGVHGLKGVLNIYSFAENSDIFAPGSSLYIKKNNKEEYQVLESESSSRKKGNFFLVKFRGVNGRDEAEFFKGKEVFINKNDLPETEDDAWYWNDLIGMKVAEAGGEELGTVENILRTGSSDILEVKSGKEEVLVPFLKDVIVSVSVNDNIIKVNLPEGLKS